MVLKLNKTLADSRANSDDKTWPPAQVQISSTRARDFITEHEIWLRRTAQIANEKVTLRIPFPCFDKVRTPMHCCSSDPELVSTDAIEIALLRLFTDCQCELPFCCGFSFFFVLAFLAWLLAVFRGASRKSVRQCGLILSVGRPAVSVLKMALKSFGCVPVCAASSVGWAALTTTVDVFKNRAR